jgi:hypothetical protein
MTPDQLAMGIFFLVLLYLAFFRKPRQKVEEPAPKAAVKRAKVIRSAPQWAEWDGLWDSLPVVPYEDKPPKKHWWRR